MDSVLLKRSLAVTERRIAELECRIECQRGIVSDLEAARDNDNETLRFAREILESLEYNYKRLIRQGRWIHAELRIVHERPPLQVARIER